MPEDDLIGAVVQREGRGSGGAGNSNVFPASTEGRPISAVGSSLNRIRGGARSPNFVTLWIIVSGLWTTATGLRILHVWVPEAGWPAVLYSGFTWAGLLVPPLTFAFILVGVSRIATGDHRSGQ
jgi:hypothetical protein